MRKITTYVIIGILLIVLFLGSTSALATVLEWHQTYGDVSNDYGRSVSQTTDGGYIIAGETASYGAGG